MKVPRSRLLSQRFVTLASQETTTQCQKHCTLNVRDTKSFLSSTQLSICLTMNVGKKNSSRKAKRYYKVGKLPRQKYDNTQKKKTRESNVCEAKAFPYYLLSFWGGSGASIFYVSTSCMWFEYKTTTENKKEKLFIMLSSSCWVFFFFSFRPSSLLYVNYRAHRKIVFSLAGASYHSKDLMRLKVIVGIVFFFVKRFLFYLH